MSQGSLTISNQSFPAFRTALNSAFQAVNTTQSGTSRPSGAVAGTLWLDTTNATTPTLKFYDGTSDISFATLNYTAHTVDWLDSTVSITGLSTTATGTVLTLTDTAHTTSVNMICNNNTALRFNELTINGSNYIGLKAPASLSADLTFTLPSTDGTSGQFLKTDGAGNLSFGTVNLSTPFSIVASSSVGSEIRIPEATTNGANYVGFKAPDSLSADKVWTLPSADGTSGQVLQTNGSGVLSFAGVSASAGQVIQVLSATDSTQRTTTSTSFVTGSNTLSVTITPSSASNKIFLICTTVGYGGSTRTLYTIYRGATNLGSADGFAEFRPDWGSVTMSYLDSPSSTSALTYQVYFKGSGGTAYLNNGIVASITAFEIKG